MFNPTVNNDTKQTKNIIFIHFLYLQYYSFCHFMKSFWGPETGHLLWEGNVCFNGNWSFHSNVNQTYLRKYYIIVLIIHLTAEYMKQHFCDLLNQVCASYNIYNTIYSFIQYIQMILHHVMESGQYTGHWLNSCRLLDNVASCPHYTWAERETNDPTIACD